MISTGNPFKALAMRFFSMSGFVVSDNDETVEILDEGGNALAFRFDLLVGEDENPSVQYLGPGSKPWERILYELRNRGRVTKLYARRPFHEREVQGEMRQWLSAERPNARFSFSQTRTEFVPVLVTNFKVCFITDEKREELHCLGVNLRTGELYENYMAALAAIQMRTTRPLSGVERRCLSMRKGYETAKRWLEGKIAAHDPTWATDALTRLAVEIEQLKSYYIEAEPDSGDSGREDRERRLKEQEEKFRPRVLVELINAGLVYVPFLRFRMRVEEGNSEEFWEVVLDGATGARQVGRVSSFGPESSRELRAQS